ncbi:UNVERIFIED_CONTAM: hypothetical protein PYX00_007718 [Menopon gallinae]|uniref:LIM zinc-binding domain-containing protein n=1 Tax=Menopon gallinae TaxID=328185 RepID=A0AAW2HJY0_9NEOP
MTAKKCEICGKNIDIRKPECEEAGVAYHINCFTCCVCDLALNERTVQLRSKHLFCKMHSIKYGHTQPLCRVYFNPYGRCYRIIYGSDLPGGEEEEEEDEDEEEGAKKKKKPAGGNKQDQKKKENKPPPKKEEKKKEPQKEPKKEPQKESEEEQEQERRGEDEDYKY